MTKMLIRKSKDYVYGIWVYKVLGMWKGYNRVKKINDNNNNDKEKDNNNPNNSWQGNIVRFSSDSLVDRL